MKTIAVSAISEADLGFTQSRNHGDGTATLYYPGDEIPPAPFVVPGITISPRQFRQALNALGLRAGVDAAIAEAPQDIKDWYRYAERIESTHPAVLATAQALGYTELQVRQVFELAASL